jgi:hypothetical protein
MFVSWECCVLSGRGLCEELSLVQRSPTDCGASLCDLERSRMRWPWPPLGCRAIGGENKIAGYRH